MNMLIQVFAFSLVMAISTVHAQQASSQKSGTGGVSPAASQTAQNTKTDQMYDKVTSVLQDTIGAVDSFFGDEDQEAFGKKNNSRMRLRLDTTYVEHHGWELNPKLKFHLVFPGLGERIRLVAN